MFLLQAMASAVTAAGAVCRGGHLNVRPVLEVGLALVACVANHDIKSAKLCHRQTPLHLFDRGQQNVVVQKKVLPSTAVLWRARKPKTFSYA
jgi:hypothetical protein